MAREFIQDNDVEKVVGGSIVFNGDHTTCGRNRNDQYKVLNYDAVIKYIAENSMKLSEKTMLKNMLEAGLIANL